MFYKPLLYPLLLQVALTFIVLFWLFANRVPEIAARRIDLKRARTRLDLQSQLPDSARISDNLTNLFEMPVLFFAAILLALHLLLQDPLLVGLAWAFVLLRWVHSLIHCTYNNVMHRFLAFIASVFFLLCLWARLAWLVLLH